MSDLVKAILSNDMHAFSINVGLGMLEKYPESFVPALLHWQTDYDFVVAVLEYLQYNGYDLPNKKILRMKKANDERRRLSLLNENI